MGLEMTVLSEISQIEKDKYHMISFICGIQNITQTNLFMKQTDSQTYKANFTIGERGWGRIKLVV